MAEPEKCLVAVYPATVCNGKVGAEYFTPKWISVSGDRLSIWSKTSVLHKLQGKEKPIWSTRGSNRKFMDGFGQLSKRPHRWWLLVETKHIGWHDVRAVWYQSTSPWEWATRNLLQANYSWLQRVRALFKALKGARERTVAYFDHV